MQLYFECLDFKVKSKSNYKKRINCQQNQCLKKCTDDLKVNANKPQKQHTPKVITPQKKKGCANTRIKKMNITYEALTQTQDTITVII